MTEPEIELSIEEADGGDAYPDTLPGPDSLLHCGGDAQAMLAYWCEQLGQDVTGSALSLAENAGLYVLELATGKWLSPEQIVAQAKKAKMQAVK